LIPSSLRAENRPRHLRTVSTLMRRSAAIRALARPRAAASTICARSQSRCAVLAPVLAAADDLESAVEPSPGHSAISSLASQTLDRRPEHPFDEQVSKEGHSADDKAGALSAPAPIRCPP
jgi:hypothetical protein